MRTSAVPLSWTFVALLIASLVSIQALGRTDGPPGKEPKLTVLAMFKYAQGGRPRAGLIADAAGNLYGTTFVGGAQGDGRVFKIAAGTNALTTLVDFNGTDNGAQPIGGLVADAAGNIYGTTSFSGNVSFTGNPSLSTLPGKGGTVFKINGATNEFTTLGSFNKNTGICPFAALTIDATGNLYGTTSTGGPGKSGTVFKLSAGNYALSVLASFNGTNGAQPAARVIADAAGNLYGTTARGGAGGMGTLFKIAARTNTLTTLVAFSGVNGQSPEGGLLADAKGNLYGTTRMGGASKKGTVFKLVLATNALTTLVSFNGVNGGGPTAGLIADAAGNLYGASVGGGRYKVGTIFKIAADTNAITTLAEFTNINGACPACDLIVDADGNLYGTAEYEGVPAGQGTVFKLTNTGFVVAKH